MKRFIADQSWLDAELIDRHNHSTQIKIARKDGLFYGTNSSRSEGVFKLPPQLFHSIRF